MWGLWYIFSTSVNVYPKETVQRYGGNIRILVCRANLRNIPSEYRLNDPAAQNASPFTVRQMWQKTCALKTDISLILGYNHWKKYLTNTLS